MRDSSKKSRLKSEDASVPALPQSEMKVETWPIERVLPYSKNARKRTPESVEKIVASIKEFGWVQPIVVDAAGVIIIGHGRRDAAISMGLEEVPVVVANNLSPGQVKALRIADNRIHEESSWDIEMLGAELLEMKFEGVDLGTTSLDFDEIIGDVFGSSGKKKKKKQTESQNGDLEFKVVVDCVDEQHQTMLLAKFKQEGLKCRALIS